LTIIQRIRRAPKAISLGKEVRRIGEVKNHWLKVIIALKEAVTVADDNEEFIASSFSLFPDYRFNRNVR